MSFQVLHNFKMHSYWLVCRQQLHCQIQPVSDLHWSPLTPSQSAMWDLHFQAAVCAKVLIWGSTSLPAHIIHWAERFRHYQLDMATERRIWTCTASLSTQTIISKRNLLTHQESSLSSAEQALILRLLCNQESLGKLYFIISINHTTQSWYTLPQLSLRSFRVKASSIMTERTS